MLNCIVSLAIFSIAVVASADVNPTTRPAIYVAHDELKKLAWQLAVPASTFNDRTVFESIALLHSLGIHHIEIGPSDVSSESADAVLMQLKSVHMDIVSYGPVDLGPDDASARAALAFAKRLKTKNVIASSPVNRREQLAKLAAEFDVNLVPTDNAVQVRIVEVDPKRIAELKHQGFKGVIVVACNPGGGEGEVDRLIDLVNALSDAIRSNRN